MYSAITGFIETPTQGIYFQVNSNGILQGLPRWSPWILYHRPSAMTL